MVHQIVVVGSLNIDLVTVTPRVPATGETLRATSFETGFGGKGANQAVACARLLPPEVRHEDRTVRMVGCVGGDRYGKDFINHLSDEGVSTGAVNCIQTAKTGTSLIIVDEKSGDNRILFSEGANGHAAIHHLGFVDMLPGLMVFQLEIPLAAVIEGLRLCRSHKQTTVLNPAPASPLPDDVYQNIDHLIVNETEASILSGVSEDKLHESLERVADIFIQKGVTCVVVTLGSQGVFWKLANGSGKTMEALTVKAIDTTAAGDTFVGGYVSSLALGDLPATALEIEKAIGFATRSASLSVQRSGAQSSIPRYDEVPVPQ